MKLQTKLIKGINAKTLPYGAVVPPIFLASTYVQSDLDHPGTFGYQRSKNPTTNAFETLFASVEGCKHCFATSTGMAATSVVFNLFKSGDRVIFNSNIYGGTFRYASTLFENQGIKYELKADLNELTELPPDTRAVFVETPSNPLLRITDVKKIVELAHKHGALVIADNTFLPLHQNLFELGVDIVVYSATKYIGGHADVLAGLVCTNDDVLAERFALIKNTLGCPLSPFDSYTLIRGIKTLKLRMDAAQKNTARIVEFLSTHEGVSQIYFAGSHSAHEKALHAQQAGGALGCVISVELNEGWDYKAFCAALKVFDLAVSLGGVESLVCQPATMTHESYPKELKDEIGIKDSLIRLAVGCEDIDDLLGDLAQALEVARKK